MTSPIQRSHFANQLDETLIGHKISIGGWIEDIRDIGKLVFLMVRDITGVVQVVITEDKIHLIKNVPRQSSIILSGLVQMSKAKDFAVEVKVEDLTVFTKAIHPLPIDPTGRIESVLDKRLDSRALDLRNPKVSALFSIRSEALHIIRSTFQGKRFIEVNTPKIIGSATEGGANLFEFEYFRKNAYLAQSPQLYKEQLILALDRVFEIGPYFRAEKSHTSRHLCEFLSVDVEAAFLDYGDMMDLVEDLIRNVSTGISKNCKHQIQTLETGKNSVPIPNLKIERLAYERCLEELSNKGENIRFGDDLSDSSLTRLGQIHPGFYFITDWPISLKPFYIHEKEDNPQLSESFDLQCGRLELVSGGRRHHDQAKLRRRLEEQGLDPGLFSDHLRCFTWGVPPHSGFGLGFDRLMMVMTNSKNIRDVVLYPRDTERLTP